MGSDMTAYYNEFDLNAAAWLRELIKMGFIANGEVDERSITEVSPSDIRGFTQCHWFAGIGGWSYALRLAGLPDNWPVWTASLPCQPFSTAGKQRGRSDERHLLPHFLELVNERRPERIFGEQVEGAIKHGWLDDLSINLERENYAVGSAVLGAHSVSAFHQRQRLYWVANANNKHRRSESFRSGDIGAGSWVESGRSGGVNGRMGDTSCDDKQRNRECDSGEMRKSEARRSSLWNDLEWLYCRDNKYRPIKRGLKPLVDRVSRGIGPGSDSRRQINVNETAESRVMRLNGYGNAIVPQVAAEFIKAFMDIS